MIKTLNEIEEGLQLLGYDARIEGQSVAFEICRFLAVLTVTEETLSVTCEVASGSEITDEAPLFMLDMNTIVSPYAFALNSAKSDGAEDDRIVLIDSVSLLSFNQEELEQLVKELRQAIYLSGPMLRQKINYSDSRAKLYFDTNELWDEMDLLDDLLLLSIIGMEDVDTSNYEVEACEVDEPTRVDVEIPTEAALPVPEVVAVDDTRRSSSMDSGYSDSSYDSGSSDSGSCDCGGGCD